MPNTKSAEKALRQSKTKKATNLFWKGKIRSVSKNLEAMAKAGSVDNAAITKELSMLQKTLDKAAKSHVIHKNKADRLKSRFASKFAKKSL